MALSLLKSLKARGHLSVEDEKHVLGLAQHQVDFQNGEDIVVEDTNPSHSCLMVSGYSARYTVLLDGRRQITAIHVPGDFVDLHSLFLQPIDHGVMSVGATRIALVPHAALHDIIVRRPELTRLLWTMTVIDAGIFRQWLVAMGRQSADSQIARFLCEMYVRLRLVDKVDGLNFELPITQTLLGDAMGISTVQANRSVQALRRAGLIRWSGSSVTILNWDLLVAAGEFDETYLNIHFPNRHASD